MSSYFANSFMNSKKLYVPILLVQRPYNDWGSEALNMSSLGVAYFEVKSRRGKNFVGSILSRTRRPVKSNVGCMPDELVSLLEIGWRDYWQ